MISRDNICFTRHRYGKQPLRMFLALYLLMIVFVFMLNYDRNVYGAAREATLPSPANRVVPVVIGKNTTFLCARTGNGREKYSTATCSQHLPSAIIIGVPKCGTMALMTFLEIHPDIVRARCPPQYQFFRTDFFRGLKFHKRQMPCSIPGQVVVEKSPTYFCFADNKLPERIKSMNKNVKLIVVVKDPVSRVISSYVQHKVARKIKEESFEDSVFLSNGTIDVTSSLIVDSSFHLYFKFWLKEFKLDQIHIVDGDNFAKNPLPELKKLERFLRLTSYISAQDLVYVETKGFYCIRSRDTKRVNCLSENKGRKHPSVEPEDIDKLKSFYKPHNEIFFKMIGRRFDWQ